MSTSAQPLRPVRLQKEGSERLMIEWNDGHHSVHEWRQLRLHCPCATCRGERERPPEPFRILKPGEIPTGPLRPLAVRPVGYYAYAIDWSDGHNTGIYTFDLLRSLCQCPACQPRPESAAPLNQEPSS